MSESTRPTVTPNDNGPYCIMGPVTIIDADGNVLEQTEETYLCRCGGSSNKPFCDGSHRMVGFKSEVRAG
ncbi:MAG: CDGSH iron-sulfur domain-containing protein [Dehalococcoidia bacterium]